LKKKLEQNGKQLSWWNTKGKLYIIISIHVASMDGLHLLVTLSYLKYGLVGIVLFMGSSSSAFYVPVAYSVNPSSMSICSLSLQHAVAHIQHKVALWIHHKNMHGYFEFGHGPMTFDRVIPLEEIFSFRSLTFVCIKFNLQVLICQRNIKSSPNFVMVW
jgi:hypothetical protein